jgi:hypothetical protein
MDPSASEVVAGGEHFRTRRVGGDARSLLDRLSRKEPIPLE